VRVESARTAERIERAQPARASAATVESAAHAAVAAALMPGQGHVDDVSIRPIQAKPSLFDAPAAESVAQAEPPLPKAFIPPAPERVNRTPRMPRIDKLPLTAQNEIRAQRGELADNHPEKQRMTLMQRLANVGLGRRGDAESGQPRAAAPQYE